ncbi:hypothetical protein CSB37_02155 [bacterium DOLZORAL124_38_8]|nr:MAG: hypothetical protein CSB37_02155 [bacterium DOLZORAL124_38_8]
MLREGFYFLYKLAQSSVFGGFILCLLLAFWLLGIQSGLRADLLFGCVLVVQILLVVFQFESKKEAKVIGLFHLVGTAMEVFKTSAAIGSWSYAHIGFFAIGNVPLFTGFMYASVGSFIARCWRILQFKFENYPPFWQTVVLSVLIYANFFTHHYLPDIRSVLFLLAGVVYGRTFIHFKVYQKQWRIPLLLACGLAAAVIFFAENVGTFSRYWVYPNQVDGWHMVPLGKFGSWFLLLILSFVLVTLVHRDKLYLRTDCEKS